MPSSVPVRAWAMRLAVWLACLVLVACATAPEPTTEGVRRGASPSWAGRPIGAPPAPNPTLKRAMIARAEKEWVFFGRQVVVFQGAEESIPHVGDWEDDGYRQSGRINSYWRVVDKPGLTGMDCQKPWSAAFMSWLMQTSGVPESQFRRASAHWIYVASLIDDSSLPGRYFIPRRISDYSPEPGDLICAYRGASRITTFDGYVNANRLTGAQTHCDLVTGKQGRTLETIGGNVRNSVSKSRLQLDAQGRLQPVPRRPWFLVLQNRL